jgi:uncharacterized membrane protein
MAFLFILSRWVHVVSACVALGGVFFMWVVLPRGLGHLEPDQRDAVLLPIRRTFKMVMHSAILLLLVTGIYNSTVNWGRYNLDPPVLHSLWGVHVLLALIAITIAAVVLAGRRPSASSGMWLGVNLVILLLVVAAASSLKWAGDKVVAGHRTVSLTEKP